MKVKTLYGVDVLLLKQRESLPVAAFSINADYRIVLLSLYGFHAKVGEVNLIFAG
jgi:hypothetical protein